MQFSLAFFPLLSLLTLVASDACVVGGPGDKVSQAEICCFRYNGTWYQNYPVQAICVLPSNSTKYEACVEKIAPPALDLTCISGEVDPTMRIVKKRDLVSYLAEKMVGA